MYTNRIIRAAAAVVTFHHIQSCVLLICNFRLLLRSLLITLENERAR